MCVKILPSINCFSAIVRLPPHFPDIYTGFRSRIPKMMEKISQLPFRVPFCSQFNTWNPPGWCDPPQKGEGLTPFWKGWRFGSHPSRVPKPKPARGDIGCCPWKSMGLVGTFFFVFGFLFRAFRHIFFRGKMAMLVSGRVSPISGGSTWRIIPFDMWLITMVYPQTGVVSLPNGLGVTFHYLRYLRWSSR